MTKETKQIGEAVKLFDRTIREEGLDYKSDVLARAITFDITSKGLFPEVNLWLPARYSISKKIGASLDLRYFVSHLAQTLHEQDKCAYRSPKLQSSISMRGLSGAIEQAIGQLYQPAEFMGVKLDITSYETGWKKEEPFFSIDFDATTDISKTRTDERYLPSKSMEVSLRRIAHFKDILDAARFAVQIYKEN